MITKKVQKGAIHIHIHIDKEKPKKEKSKMANAKKRFGVRRRGKKGLSHRDIGSHIPFNAVANPMAVQLNTLENMRLQLLPSHGDNINELYGSKANFGLSTSLEKQIAGLTSSNQNLTSRMDNMIEYAKQFKPMPEIEITDLEPKKPLEIEPTIQPLDEIMNSIKDEEATSSPVPQTKPPSAEEEPKQAEEESDEERDEGDIVIQPIFTDKEKETLSNEFISNIKIKLWKKIFNELGYEFPEKPTIGSNGNITPPAISQAYRTLVKNDFLKRNEKEAKKKRLDQFKVIQDLI